MKAATVSTNNSERTRVRRHPERSAPTQAQTFLTQGTVAHVGFVADGQPFVIPFTYEYNLGAPDKLYLHGSPASRALKRIAAGEPICITVTITDAIIYSRSAMYHSMNYRSVMCFGRGRLLESAEEKRRVFEAMTSRYLPGRIAGVDYEAAPLEHLNATALIEVAIEEMSGKTRTGGPAGPHDAQPDALGSAGVFELTAGECPEARVNGSCPFSKADQL